MKRKGTYSILSFVLLGALASGVAIVAYAAGTSLSISFSDATIVCNEDGSGATVTFNYTVTSTGAADAATVTGSIDGGDESVIQTIASGNIQAGGGWTFGGRIKTADGSYTTTLADGTHTFTVCATQQGSQGNPNKTTCETQTVVVACSGCANTGPFGEVPHNKNLCLANGHIEVQFRGNFGDPATLVIEGPNHFSLTASVNRAGDSCNYHYNWDPNVNNGNGGAGSYTFTVTGNSQDPLTFTADLLCQVRGR